MHKERTLKQWLIIFLIVFLLVPFVMIQMMNGVNRYLFQEPIEIESITPWVKEHVLDEAHFWVEESWQKQLNEKAREMHLNIHLYDEKEKLLISNIGEEKKITPYQIYSDDWPSNDISLGWITLEYQVYDGKKLLGVAYVEDRRPLPNKNPYSSEIAYHFNEWGFLFVWIGLCAIVLIFSAKFLKQKMLQPLIQFQTATNKMSHYDFHFSLPTTPVKEINELSHAFSMMQMRLQESLDKQETMEKERKLFISSIIHDLRTPLFSIRGYLEGIKHGVAATPEQVNKYVEISYQKANVLNQLISDLHTFSSLNYLEQPLQLNKIDFTAFLQQIIESFQPELQKKAISLNLCIEEAVFCELDDYVLGRALHNLIANAIQYTPNNGEITIDLYDLKEQGQCLLRIADNGSGIPEADIAHLFSPLYRGEKSRNRKTGGTGLGLAIAQKAVEKHCGTIRVYNNANGGATFEMLLPKNER